MSKFALDHKRPIIIAGPCSVETHDQITKTCLELAGGGMTDLIRAGVWKPRTKPGSFEGSGEQGLKWLGEASALAGLPFAIEVASAQHVELAVKYGASAIWIGGRTTGSPFQVQDIADALNGMGNVAVFIKNPLNPDLELWAGAVERFLKTGIDQSDIALVHRGFTYYGSSKLRNAPMWHMSLEMREKFPGMALLCDPSHIAGKKEYLHEVSQTAADMCYDGLMIESHSDPENALTDRAQQITPSELTELVSSLSWRSTSNDNPSYINALESYREQIDLLDRELFELLGKRMMISEKIGEIKRDNNVAIFQQQRWKGIVQNILSVSEELNLSPEFIKSILEEIHIESILHQRNIMNG